MRLSPILAEGNFRLSEERPTTNGLKIPLLLRCIEESSPDQLVTRRTCWKRIKSIDVLAMTAKDEEKREKANFELKQMVIN